MTPTDRVRAALSVCAKAIDGGATEAELNIALGRAQEALSLLDGMVLVPIEPSEEMIRAAHDAWRTTSNEPDPLAALLFKKQIDYSAYLQQIIEALCHGHTIPEPETAAIHHYEMAVAYWNTRTPSTTGANERGEPVAWQVYNELVKEWTSAYADKAKADQLVKDGYKIRPLYAQHTPQPSPQSDMVAVPREVMGRVRELLLHADAGFDTPYPSIQEALSMLQPFTKGEK